VVEQEKCSNYTYRFVLRTHADNRKIAMYFPTRSIMENLEELLHSGDCVILNYNAVLKFLNPDMNLECEFQINAIELAEVISDGVSQPHSCAETHVRSSTVLTNTPVSNVASGTIPLQNSQQQTVLYCAPGIHLTGGASANYNSLPSAPAKTDLYSDPKGNISPALSNDVKSCEEKLSYSDRSLLTEKSSYNLTAGYVLSKSLSESSWKCPICEQIAPIVPVSLPQPEWQVSSFVPDSKRCKMCGLKSCEEKLSYSDRSLLTEKTSYSLPTGYVLSNSSSDSSWKCPICEQIAPIVPVSLPHAEWQFSSFVPDSKLCKMCGLKSWDEKLLYSDRSSLIEKTFYNLPTGYVLSNSSSDSSWKCPICEQIAPIVPVSLPHPEWQVSSSAPDSKVCKMCGLKSCDEKLSYSDRSSLKEKTSYTLPAGHVLSNSSSDSSWKCPICDQIAPSVPVSLPQPGWHVSSFVPDSKRCKMCGQIIQYPSVGRSEEP